MDVEQFIELVRERPCLYDYRDVLYKNKKEKEKHWNEIATTMEITSEIAKSKWKNLKDNYSKHLKGTTTTKGHYFKYIHWSWASNMEFMKKHINFTPPTTSVDNHNNQDDHKFELNDSAQSSTRSDDRSDEISVDKRRLSIHEFRHDNSTPRSRKVFQYMENGEEEGYDATDLIFLGYAKAIKSFSIRRQAEIKLRIAKIITEEEIAHYEESSVYPESPVYYSQSPSPQYDPLNSRVHHEVQIKHEED